MSGDDFLSRWSRRKHQARKGEVAAEPPSVASAASPPQAGAPPEQPPAEAGTPAPLPAIESLNLESDFTGFMKPDVDRGLRNQALRALFSDPRFNVMDGLDVYIDDYSKPDPLPEGWLEKMHQVARLGAYEPPKEEPPEASDPAVEPASDVTALAREESAPEPKDPSTSEDKIEGT